MIEKYILAIFLTITYVVALGILINDYHSR